MFSRNMYNSILAKLFYKHFSCKHNYQFNNKNNWDISWKTSEHWKPFAIITRTRGNCIITKIFKSFCLDYIDMQGIHPNTCIHHIYIDDQIKPVRRPQRRMNPMMKEIMKEELHKLVQVGFIYHISFLTVNGFLP